MPPVTPATSEQYRIAVASFRTAARAEQIAAELKEKQIATVARVDASGGWYQVIAGPYPTIDAARDVQRVLERSGFPDSQISLILSPGSETSPAR